MLILLPPSETKRSGGEGTPLSTTWNLSFPELDETRRSLVQSLCELAADPVEMISALKLGPQQHDEVHVNAGILDAPTMPAIERFTGVLFDAIDVGTLDKPGRDFLASRILIQSALFGLVRASDFIPAYRLSFDSRLPSLPPLKKVWASLGAPILATHEGLILDLRSEGYAALSPLPDRADAFFVRAVGRAANGELRQLNHFNKKGKGVFVRAVGQNYPHWVRSQAANDSDSVPDDFSIDNIDTLLEWARVHKVELTKTDDPRELQLVINEADYPPIGARG